jgi:hypothetical protein
VSTRVLVVTSRTAFAEALSVALRASDLDYVGARRIDDALRVLEDERMPAAVIVDLVSAPADPEQICDAVRAKEAGAQVPVIFCGTGNESIKSTTDALIVGGDGYFGLPVEAQRVVAKIATYVGCPVPELPSNLVLTAEEERGSQPPAPRERPSSSELLDQTAPMTPRPVSIEDLADQLPENFGDQLSSPPSDMAEVTDSLEQEAVAAALAAAKTAEGRTLEDESEEIASSISAEVFGEDEKARDEALARRAQAEREAEEAAREAAARAADLERIRAEAEAEVKRVAEERARLEEIERKRAEAEEEARRAVEEAAARAAAEKALLEEIERQRAQAVADAEREAAAAARRAEEERARLEELARKRAEAEEAVRRAVEDAARRTAEEEERLSELEQKRFEAEEEARRALEEAAKRSAEELARLEDLARQREAAEEEARRALEETAKKSAEEQARLFELEVQRQAAEEAARRALEEAARREAEERARLEEIALRRREAEAEAQRALEEAARREAEERARLDELAQRRILAEEEAAASVEEARKLEAAERARLEELMRRRLEAEEQTRRLLEDHAAREIAAREALEETRRRESEERARLDEVARRRHEAEVEAARALAETEQRAQQARAALEETQRKEAEERARLEELERDRARAAADAARASEELARREAEERARLARLAEERARLEETARIEADARAARERDERTRLERLAAEREKSEAEMKAALEERARLLALEEERLHAIQKSREEAEAEAERRRQERARLENDSEERLAAARKERERLEVEAQQELERIARIRAEEELARRELEEKRTRARLGFQSGRFDAVPAGQATLAHDVGSQGRPVTDAQGVVVGGPLPSFAVLDAEPPPPPPFVALEPPAGRFAEGELPSLLWAAHHLKVTGAVDIATDDGRSRTLFLEEGEPVLVSSTLPVDRPEEGLLRAGLVTVARYNELRAGPLRSARRTAAALVAEGVLKPEELFPAVRGVLTEQVLSLLEHESGTFTYREEHAHAADRARLEHRFDALLAEGVRRKFDERRLWLVLGGPSSLVAPDDRARELPPLSPEEKLALARLDGTRSLEDVVLETGISAVVVLRTALIAISSGTARMVARGMPLDPAERQAQRERSVAIDRARVLDRLHAARNGDYFTFLGVDLHASPFEVQRAAERVRQRFDPMRFADPAFADLAAALKEIVEVTFDAEAVLGDEALAEGYRKNLLGQMPRVMKRRA